MTRARRWLSIALGALALLAGCASSSDQAAERALDALTELEPPTSTTTTTTPEPPPPECEPTASLRPPQQMPARGAMPPGTFMHEIQERGYLVVGVDQNTFGFGYRDPRTGQLEGFDIDLLKVIAYAIFGDRDPGRIVYKTVISSERIPAVRDGDVDIVASIVTMTCKRWQEVSFSTEYYRGYQTVLVRSDSEIEAVADLDGKRVCATLTSTSIDRIQELVPSAVPHPVATRTECLVDLQAGEADAIATDDSILYGFQFQDPNTRMLPDVLADEPYGLVISKLHPEFARFVNGVLEQTRADGTWHELHRALRETFAGRFGDRVVIAEREPPVARYQD